jgi:hypothetical protein
VLHVPLGLQLDFDTSSKFNIPLKGIKVLEVPLDTSSFTSSFVNDALLKNIWHVDLFPRMGDVHVAFEILAHCFMQ